MAIFKINKTKDFVVMSNYHLKEKEMSLKAKGLLSQMLSLPNDWDYSIAGLVSINKENETSIKNTLNELKKFNYLKVTKLMPNETKSGRIEYIYDIYEKPYIKKQEDKKQGIENLWVEIQGIENQGQYNIKELNINKLNINKNNKKEKKETEFDVLINDNFTDEEVKQVIYEFIKMRKAIKKPLTTHGLVLIINKLKKLSNNSKEQIKILNNSIMNNWQGIFPLKPDEKEKEEVKYYIDERTEEEYYASIQNRRQ